MVQSRQPYTARPPYRLFIVFVQPSWNPMILLGQQYWIELEAIRIRVRVDGTCAFLPGWFNCTSERSGVQLIVPEQAIREMCKDGDGRANAPLP